MDAAEVIVQRLNDETRAMTFDYRGKNIEDSKGNLTGTVLVIENLREGKFDLNWLDSALLIEPRIVVTNVTVDITIYPRIKVYLEYEK